MLEGLITMAWTGVTSGGAFGDLLYQWEQMGMFAYILPFLLIFAVVYGILMRTKIFEAHGVNEIIAVVVGLMALQFQMVSVFFSEIFPRLGVGLSVILVLLILVGMFIPKKGPAVYVMFTISGVIAIVVIAKSFDWVGWTSNSGWWSQNAGGIIGVIFILVVLGMALMPKNQTTPESIFSKILESIK